MTTFYVWLRGQMNQSGLVGRVARIAHSSPDFPRTNRLYLLLRAYPDDATIRQGIKSAHRAWRRTR
jgi:hypothetical protein